jgi:predicted ATP-grasp superfamily ATP-dependent carboligase
MIKGVQTIDKRPLLTIEDIQNYVLGLEIKNNELQQQLDKYKNVIDKIKEYIEKNCVNQKISKEVGYKCFTMADTRELEHIWKLLEEVE